MTDRKRVMIIYKRSPLLAAGTSVAAANTRFRENHAQHYATLRKVTAVLKSLNIVCHQHLRGADADHRKHDIIISIGGDGTFLDAARRSSEKQFILGVNSDPSWSIGQFCAANAETFETIFKQTIFNPRFKKLFKLTASFLDEKPVKVVECLNDILVCHANPAAMSRYSLVIGNKKEIQRSSGIWISSAAGSTGAISSAGGCRIPVDKRSIAYKPRELYLGRGIPYHLTGGVIKPNQFALITSMMPHGRVFFDGAHIKYPLVFGKALKIQTSPCFIRMIYA